jgi:hypothetical protein
VLTAGRVIPATTTVSSPRTSRMLRPSRKAAAITKEKERRREQDFTLKKLKGTKNRRTWNKPPDLGRA